MLFIASVILFLLQVLHASKLKVLHPTALKTKITKEIHGRLEKGLINSSLGNFGHFNYGTTMRGRLHYPIQNTDGCLPFQDAHVKGEHLKEGKQHNHQSIILVDRGNCHFVVKA